MLSPEQVDALQAGDRFVHFCYYDDEAHTQRAVFEIRAVKKTVPMRDSNGDTFQKELPREKWRYECRAVVKPHMLLLGQDPPEMEKIVLEVLPRVAEAPK